MMKLIIQKTLINITVLLILFITGCSTTIDNKEASLTSNTMTAEESKEQALKLALLAEQNNNFEQALLNYVKALEFDNGSAETFYKIGDMQKKLGNTQLSIRAFKGALTAVPNYVPALTEMGIFSFEQKYTAKAKKLLTKAIELDQQRLHNNFLTMKQKLEPETVEDRRFEYAQKQRLKNNLADNIYLALDNESPIRAYNVYGVMNDLKSNHKIARELFMLVLKVKENSPLILSNLGYSYYLSNDFILAATYFKKAIDIDPNFARAKSNLGLVYVRNGQYRRAIQLLTQVMTDAEAYNDVGYFLMLEGRYMEAEYFLQQAIERSPSYFVKGNTNLENVKMYREEKTGE